MITTARTFLFVPGDRPDRFAKALASEADVVILDMEDSVAPAAKERAREAIRSFLDPSRPVMLRPNCPGTPWFEEDLALCNQAGTGGIALPKAEPGFVLDRVASIAPTLALIETAIGVRDISAIAATQGVARIGIGAIDLSLDLDMTEPETLLDPVLLAMTIASRAARIASPVAGVTPDFRDPTIAQRDATHARALGFGGKLCIHPAQIAPVIAGFRPSEEALERARRVVAADAASGGAALALDGLMVDRPVVDRARRLLGWLR